MYMNPSSKKENLALEMEVDSTEPALGRVTSIVKGLGITLYGGNT